MNILPDFIINAYANGETLYTGIDSLVNCTDKNYFKNYPYSINYKYNSRGFRDTEWPEQLDDCIWCVGDSFTSGVGQPYEHIWPQVLSNKLNIRTINMSMDGASNNWISRKIVRIAEVIKPKTIIVQWSYVNRREKEIPAEIPTGAIIDDYDRRIWYTKDSHSIKDIENAITCVSNAVDACKKSNTVLINSFIPEFVDTEYADMFWTAFENLNTPVVKYNVIDWARDKYHYDIATATLFVDNLLNSKYINI
jgi:hypothetical protein